jgi:hypothetical protein
LYFFLNFSKTGELGEEYLVYLRQSAKARKRDTSSKSPTSPSCKNYFQTQKQYNYYHSSTNSPVRYKPEKSLRKHHSLSKIKLSYEEKRKNENNNKNLEGNSAEEKSSSLPVYYYYYFPCQILLNQLHFTRKSTKNISMSAAKVRVHNTSTSSIDAVVEPLKPLEKIHVDSRTLRRMGFKIKPCGGARFERLKFRPPFLKQSTCF